MREACVCGGFANFEVLGWDDVVAPRDVVHVGDGADEGVSTRAM
jgi:hypothetical protein